MTEAQRQSEPECRRHSYEHRRNHHGGRSCRCTPATLSWQFIHWGLGLFITGFLTGFVPIAHYIHGAVAGDVGPVFLKNMTLWWGCPAVLAELTLKTGSLGMVAIGLCYLATTRQGTSRVSPVANASRSSSVHTG